MQQTKSKSKENYNIEKMGGDNIFLHLLIHTFYYLLACNYLHITTPHHTQTSSHASLNIF